MLEQNLDEMVKVNFVNIAALAISVSEFSDYVRCASMFAALIYTVVKTVQTIQEMKKK